MTNGQCIVVDLKRLRGPLRFLVSVLDVGQGIAVIYDPYLLLP